MHLVFCTSPSNIYIATFSTSPPPHPPLASDSLASDSLQCQHLLGGETAMRNPVLGLVPNDGIVIGDDGLVDVDGF